MADPIVEPSKVPVESRSDRPKVDGDFSEIKKAAKGTGGAAGPSGGKDAPGDRGDRRPVGRPKKPVEKKAVEEDPEDPAEPEPLKPEERWDEWSVAGLVDGPFDGMFTVTGHVHWRDAVDGLKRAKERLTVALNRMGISCPPWVLAATACVQILWAFGTCWIKSRAIWLIEKALKPKVTPPPPPVEPPPQNPPPGV